MMGLSGEIKPQFLLSVLYVYGNTHRRAAATVLYFALYSW